MDTAGQLQITGIFPDSVWREGQAPLQGYRVEFITPTGIRSHIHVPRGDNLESAIEDAITQESEKLDSIAQKYPSVKR